MVVAVLLYACRSIITGRRWHTILDSGEVDSTDKQCGNVDVDALENGKKKVRKTSSCTFFGVKATQTIMIGVEATKAAVAEATGAGPAVGLMRLGNIIGIGGASNLGFSIYGLATC